MDHHRHDSGELHSRIDSGCTAFAPAKVNFDLAHLAICYQSREDALRSDFNTKEAQVINGEGLFHGTADNSEFSGGDSQETADYVSGTDRGEPLDVGDTEWDGGSGYDPAAEEATEESAKLIYLGEFTCTGYCPNSCCCGEYATGYTASGTLATEGRTVACNALPFGTQIMIDGHVYTVEDTGYTPYGEAWLDVFFQDHESALNFGVQTKEVYLIE